MNPNTAKLDMLADLQGYISRHLQELYDASRHGDYLLQDELSKALVNADRFAVSLRILAQIAERGTPKSFDAQEQKLLDELLRSNDLVRERKVIPYRRTPPEGGAA